MKETGKKRRRRGEPRWFPSRLLTGYDKHREDIFFILAPPLPPLLSGTLLSVSGVEKEPLQVSLTLDYNVLKLLLHGGGGGGGGVVRVIEGETRWRGT